MSLHADPPPWHPPHPTPSVTVNFYCSFGWLLMTTFALVRPLQAQLEVWPTNDDVQIEFATVHVAAVVTIESRDGWENFALLEAPSQSPLKAATAPFFRASSVDPAANTDAGLRFARSHQAKCQEEVQRYSARFHQVDRLRDGTGHAVHISDPPVPCRPIR
jgi:hypothetical protein